MKPHRTDALSLTFGLIFVGAVTVWVLNKVVNSELPGIGWFVAAALLIAGSIGLVTALRSDRSNAASEAAASEAAASEAAGDPAAPEGVDSELVGAAADDPIYRDPATLSLHSPTDSDKSDESR
ncbi:MAG TPA: hypothetical protein VK453_10385 [Micromonosporaceae bacterium]|nr:hypothetical protein [Micromonosporaceae bacterium]